MRLQVDGGTPETICPAESFVGGAWSAAGTIVFAGQSGNLLQVAATGGTPRPLLEPDRSKAESSLRFPHFLPDDRHFLFFTRSGAGVGNSVSIGSLDAGEPKHLMESVSNALFIPPGHLLFWRDDAIRAQPFDPVRLEFTGESFPVVPGARFEPDTGWMVLSASRTGLLAYAQGQGATAKSRLVVRDREGKEIQALGENANYYAPSFSRSGRRVAVDMSDAMNNGDVWIHDLSRPGATRLTMDPGDDSDPVWGPDDGRMIFFSAASGHNNVYQMALASPGEAKLIFDEANSSAPSDWSRDGRFAALGIRPTGSRQEGDIWIHSFETGKTQMWLATPFLETDAFFSPDGRWLAYTSNQSGREEIYVRPFPGPGEARQISLEGGVGARFRADGREMYYLTLEGVLMAAEVRNDREFEVGAPRPLFKANLRWIGKAPYDVSPDGKSFVIVEALSDESHQPLSLIIGWTPALGTR
ncbi:MAG TPA: hypothetical protein VFG76_05985 [Candidatus Polarisedimenticolia bacterium]|nr:hypothetical protein [Candidatus Polarisedimenticolia bacterium]